MTEGNWVMTEGWEERVRVELAELNVKRDALADFIDSDAFLQLTEYAQVLLEVQLDAMDLYAKALWRRLEQVLHSTKRV